MRLALLSLVAGLAGCASNPAPSGWLAPAQEAQTDPYGAWIVLVARDSALAEGEFLAVDRDSVYVLPSSGEVRVFAVGSVHQARIAYYDAEWSGLAGWTTLGAFSTLSNGWFAVFTFPLWVIAGPIATGGQSRHPIKTVRQGESWTDVLRYARYPQGVPHGMPRRMKPKPRRFRTQQP